ncbi:hypothetical protein BDZ97DRAFT_1751511 [Flammula alnicola]|nr:hypothetical protein BDZ97DRAFT_1751511 [Flammula alnicola]
MTISFTSLEGAFEAEGGKKGANTRPNDIMKIDHFYKAVPLHDIFTKKLADPNSFSLSYTVLCCITQEININNEKDYKQIVDKTTKKSLYEVKVFVVKNKMSLRRKPSIRNQLYLDRSKRLAFSPKKRLHRQRLYKSLNTTTTIVKKNSEAKHPVKLQN